MTLLRATARLQLHKAFSFDDACRVVPYYAALGVSHIYASPILTARSGSTHGYDIVDPTRINPELGGEEAWRRFVSCLRNAGMGVILDIVPNHMGVGPENPWWQHVLEWGQNSPYAHWFDIDWHPADETLQGKIMAPFLGQPYGDVLSAGEIKLEFDDKRGKFFVAYYTHRFPVAPADYADILRVARSDRLAPVIAAIGEWRDAAGEVTQHGADIAFGMLRDCAASGEGMQDIRKALDYFRSDTSKGFNALHQLLERQYYRLAWWRCAADGINWRRFFEVADLAGVRVEQDDVFEATHALIFRLYTEGLIDGVRIDHVDGLADPAGYCRKLRRRLQALGVQRPAELPPAPAYIIVEKILAPDEQLRSNWEVDGTSGYDFMDRVGALLHDAAGEEPITSLWNELTDSDRDFAAEVRQARRQLLENNLAGEFESAARALHALARTDLHTRDYSLGTIRRVFAELLVCFPVYRTYVNEEGSDPLDSEVIERSLTQARQSVERTEAPLLEMIGRWLAGHPPGDTGNIKVKKLYQRAITRFQQLTPPLAAKSVEDTAFYRYGRLLSRNEVGADPGQFSISIQEFHEANKLRADRFPHSLLATATHDHKRGEDVRARIAALSEMPHEWGEAVREWMRMNGHLRAQIQETDGTICPAPKPADEIMLYQMLVGAWPIGLDASAADGIKAFAHRMEQWQTKALREAKQVSDWVLPNEAYEAGCRAFLFALLDPRPDNAFLPRLIQWAGKITPVGMLKSLSQTVLRLTSPGIPDLYQGCECWDLSLVDPDNRRPVDYAVRRQALEALIQCKDLQAWRDGYVKQKIIRQVLALRADHPDLFLRGDYQALELGGPYAKHALAFIRRDQDQAVMVVAAHLPWRVLGKRDVPKVAPDAWQDTAISLTQELSADWTDILTGEKRHAVSGRLLLRDILDSLPAAVLMI